ncbi:ribonuclease 1-like [Durio zibethinus]|uniref:Ribonuclease 1-like n=1 Tax=Durio zibethinus TaxID=66656 RepID=A0A6P6AHW1_DURZI|nr:ribonuclease 1-like [Durio zibethinus]
MHSHLLAAAVLATLLVSAATSDFAFYKLSLIWPTSACNTGIECKSSIPKMFTIHGLWPTFADGTRVPPYNGVTNKCNPNPVGPEAILEKLMPIKGKLELMWPNLRYNKEDSAFWKIEWEHHGMCSDYYQDPYGYFNAALTLAETSQYNPLKVMGIQPADKTLYQVKKILDNVKKKVGAYPQISCNMMLKVGTLQLREIRFCFKRTKKLPPSVLQDCPNKVDDRCTNPETDYVRFPPASPIFSTPNITWEFDFI